jgi:hypothetical protein
MSKKRGTTFEKTQRERAKREKQAEKRARRQHRTEDDPEFNGPRPLTPLTSEATPPTG